ncbi:MAG: hypothetical protein KJ804_03685 [Proteobacteria bacterium]|nr:hypothetical protein [Pseudomonadota bacterium]MBU1057405.1 hypothetical protein [Pseudomonadota bacterium]
MYHSAFQLNQDFLSSLCERIHALKDQYRDDKPFASLFGNKTFFSNDILANIIDTAYWASQIIEEGNQMKMSIVYREREPSANIFHFDSSLPLTSHNLVKLGSALESSFSDICIGPGKDGQPQIWGLRLRSPSHLTTDLWLQVLGPGNILIICNGRGIAALIGNQAVFIDPSSFFGAIIAKVFSNGKSIELTALNFYRFNTLLYIAQAMRAHQRGGTLLVVPEDNAWKKSIGHPVLYTGGSNFLEPKFTSEPSSSTLSVRDLFNLYQKATATQDENFINTRSQIIDQCNRIGRLTAIDGALVMTFDRYIHCFGAKIQAVDALAGSDAVRVIRPVEGDQGTKTSFMDLGGTRHCSAAQFAFDQPDSISIVASQGGNVSFFTREKSTGELLVIQKAELALMYEGISGVLWNLFKFTEKE